LAETFDLLASLEQLTTLELFPFNTSVTAMEVIVGQVDPISSSLRLLYQAAFRTFDLPLRPAVS
jgi:hypothetical protein